MSKFLEDAIQMVAQNCIEIANELAALKDRVSKLDGANDKKALTAKEYLKKENFIDFVVNPSDLVEYQKTVSQLMEDYKNNCL